MFIYMGVGKASDPVGFLKLVRQYDVLHHHFALNFVASTLPWFEIFCGMLLVFGIAVRGTAVMLVLMLVSFTALIFFRAWAMRETSGLAFCAIKFDCGCGGGEVLICRKLVGNILLTGLSLFLILSRKARLCLRHRLL